MILVVVCAVLAKHGQDALLPGDAWTIERTYHFLDEATGIDLTNVERTDYKVLESFGSTGFSLSALRYRIESRTPKGKNPFSDSKPVATKLRFGGGGAPQFEDFGADPVAARVDRMQWTTAENRAGISWSRTFRAQGVLPAGKVTVRPHGAEGAAQSLLGSYREEGSPVRGEGTATAAFSPRIVTSLKLTLTDVPVPGANKTAKVAVNQTTLKRK